MSLLNSSIDVALKKQSDNFLQYLDSRISQLKPMPLPVDDFTFKGEGNRIQFKFNSDRSAKLSEILDCVKTGKFDYVEYIIKSELVEYTQRNKVIKIADRHGWDVVKEYTIHPLADDNDDAVKLRAAINRVTRRRSMPYDRAYQPNQPGRSSFRRQYEQTTTKTGSQQPTFQPGSCFECHLPGHFARQCRTRIYSFLQESRPAPQLQLQQTLPSHPNNPRKDQVEYDLNFFDFKRKCEIKRVPHL